MKPSHILFYGGLLVAGAALAGALAMRMAEPPPLPVASHTHTVGRSQSPAPAPAAAVQTAAAQAKVEQPLPAPAPVIAAETAPNVAPAPPPIYYEPPHAVPTARRKPFPEIAKVFAPPSRPVPYEPPTQAVPAAVPAPQGEPPHVATEAAALPASRQVELKAGTPLTVRLLETLSSDHAATGDTFQATLADPLVADGLVIAERGARVTGRIVDARRAARFTGVSQLELKLSEFTTADGQSIPITCDSWLKRSDSMSRGSAAKIGGGAALGAVIGAIAGGGFGAAIGAGAGGTAGAGAAAITGAKPVTIPSETVLRFRIASPVTITERPL